MKNKRRIWNSIILFDVLILIIGSLFSLYLQFYNFNQNAELFTNTIRNDFLISDRRSINKSIMLAMKQNGFLSIQIDNDQALSRKRFSHELNIGDVKLTSPILANSNDQSTSVGKIIFKYSIWPALILVLFVWFFFNLLLIALIPLIKKYLESTIIDKQEKIRLEKESILARQVAHDIRSPIAALNMVIETMSKAPSLETEILKNASLRINDIANELLQKGSHQLEKEIVPPKELRVEFLPSIIDILVSEKRMQFRSQPNLDIEFDFKNGIDSFALINKTEISRMLSNLFNNSVESMHKPERKILIQLSKDSANKKINISIEDNGSGIPASILDKIGISGLSFGKKHLSDSGNGLGMHHAFKVINDLGGNIKIDSTIDVGTKINIALPSQETPIWFAKSISLTNNCTLVSLDDDLSIHQIWSRRMQNLDKLGIEHVIVKSAENFEALLKNRKLHEESNTRYLIDYDLLDQSVNGLDLIIKHKINNNSILVTSRFNEEDIQNKAVLNGVSIIPKSLSALIPVTTTTAEKSENIDVVLLDDDILVRTTWEYAAKKKNIKLLTMSTSQELWSIIKNLDKNCIFYVDINLAGEDNGESISKILYESGYQNIFIATGYSKEQLNHINWVKGIVDKKPNF